MISPPILEVPCECSSISRVRLDPKPPNIAHSADNLLPIRLPITTVCPTFAHTQWPITTTSPTLPTAQIPWPNITMGPTQPTMPSHSLSMPMGCAAGPGPRPASWKRHEVLRRLRGQHPPNTTFVVQSSERCSSTAGVQRHELVAQPGIGHDW